MKLGFALFFMKMFMIPFSFSTIHWRVPYMCVSVRINLRVRSLLLMVFLFCFVLNSLASLFLIYSTHFVWQPNVVFINNFADRKCYRWYTWCHCCEWMKKKLIQMFIHSSVFFPLIHIFVLQRCNKIGANFLNLTKWENGPTGGSTNSLIEELKDWAALLLLRLDKLFSR